MKLYDLSNNLLTLKNNELFDRLQGQKIPDISLLNQDESLLKLNRNDTFRLVLYFYPMTGNPNKALPENWSSIQGAKGCTPQACSFRDNYDKLIKLNSLPVGISSQSVDDIKEMTLRLNIPYDVVSDQNLEFTKKLKLPTFSVGKKVYIKRLTLIVEKSLIKHVFYPISEPDKHILEVLDWLKKN